MARSRIELHEILVNLLGSNQVYFRAPSNVQMKYPALVYTRSDYKNSYADDRIYRSLKAYTITAIYRDPDSDLPDRILELPCCKFDRHYMADNLNHDIFTIYF